VLNLAATLPSASPNAIYGSKHILHISNLVLQDSGASVIPSLADDGVHAAVYVGTYHEWDHHPRRDGPRRSGSRGVGFDGVQT
jgi:hypothetical protein